MRNQRRPEDSKPRIRRQSHAMLDAIERMDGGSGGAQEASAWAILACAAGSPAVAAMACAQAAKLGVSPAELAELAIKSDSATALAAAMELGGLVPNAMIDDRFNRKMPLPVVCIEMDATRCLGMLARMEPDRTCKHPGMVYGDEPRSWLFLAAIDARAPSVDALLAGRPWSQGELDAALAGMAGRALGIEAQYRHEDGETVEEEGVVEIADKLVARGAKWSAPHVSWMGEPPEEGRTIAHELASKMFDPVQTASARRGTIPKLAALWAKVEASPGWESWGSPGNRLGVFALGQPMFEDSNGAARIAKACAKEGNCDRMWEALGATVAQKCLAAGSRSPKLDGPTTLLDLVGELRMAGVVPGPSPRAVGRMIARVAPASGFPPHGSQAASAAVFVERCAAQTADPAALALARSVGDAIARLAGAGDMPWKDREKAWERVGLELASFAPDAPAGSAMRL